MSRESSTESLSGVIAPRIDNSRYRERATNPFRPGFAAPPPVLAGRDEIVEEMQTITALRHQASGAHRVLYGPRGVGKTVLIDRFGRIGADRAWGVVQVEVRRRGDLYEPLLQGFGRIGGPSQRIRKTLTESARDWSQRRQQLNLGVYRAEATRHHEPGDEAAEHLRNVWLTVAAELAARRAGVMVLIDEAQNAQPDHLNMLGPILQDLSRADHANVVVFAGLMGLPRHLVESVSYAERLVQTRLGHLGLAATAQAIAIPAADAGKTFDENALHHIVHATGGYPYFVQLYAFHAFEVAVGDRITLADAQTAAARAGAALDDGMFRTRWEALPPGEQRFLQLMASVVDGDGVARIADLAAAAGTSTQQWSVTRSRLIERGVLESARHGALRCSQPGFIDFVARRTELADHSDRARQPLTR